MDGLGAIRAVLRGHPQHHMKLSRLCLPAQSQQKQPRVHFKFPYMVAEAVQAWCRSTAVPCQAKPDPIKMRYGMSMVPVLGKGQPLAPNLKCSALEDPAL